MEQSYLSIPPHKMSEPYHSYAPAVSKFAADVPYAKTTPLNWKEKLGGGALPVVDTVSKIKAVDTFDTIKTTIAKALEYKLVVLFIVFILTGVLLVVLNPPMAQEVDEAGNKKKSPGKIFTWSALSGLIAFLIPFGVGYFKKEAAPSIM